MMGPEARVHVGRWLDIRLLGWLAVPLAAVVAVAGCGGSADRVPTARAQAYVEALHQAWTAEFANVAQFAAPDATFDMELVEDRDRVAGRPVIAQMLRDAWEHYPVSVTGDGPAYVSQGGALDPSVIGWDTYRVPQVAVFWMSSEGFEEFAWFGSVKAGANYKLIDPEPPTSLAARYVAAWGGADPTGLESLYADPVSVADGLLELNLEGHADIARATTAQPGDGGLPGATLREIPEGGGSAIYTAYQGGENGIDALRGVVLLLDVPGQVDCPGPVGVVLDMDAHGLVSREERFHRTDAVDRCLDVDERAVWWEDVAFPGSDTLPTRTGTFSRGGLRIPLWNSTAPREQLLAWAVDRFSEGLVAPPEPRSVTFTPPDPDLWAAYGFIPGSGDIPLPATGDGCPDDGCVTWPAEQRAQALTALAHVWLADEVRDRMRAEYAAGIGQDWTVTPDPGQDSYPVLGPAAYQAAHTLAWGLMDQPYPLPGEIAGLSCQELAADFLLLTSASTAAAACDTLGGP